MMEKTQRTPQNAVILAAGFGMRMVPINMEYPKGLLVINGEPLIERLIRQLQEVDIKNIYVIVGFMKEKYEYLVEKFGVHLLVNTDYAIKNNLYSLQIAKDYLEESYIMPCDIWCAKNPFRKKEENSWYMVTREKNVNSFVQINEDKELIINSGAGEGNVMVGISFLTTEDAGAVKKCMEQLCEDRANDHKFWEVALIKENKMIVSARVFESADVIEINTYEQFRRLEKNSVQLQSESLQVICRVFGVHMDEITDICVLKRGMTNRSFIFSCKGKRYIMRIPGAGTEQLINRKQEAMVYQVIKGLSICDHVVYINEKNGYKITEVLENARVCNPFHKSDVQKCMSYLKNFHGKKLKVNHEFNLFKQIEFYEELRGNIPSVYKDYNEVKKQIYSLKPYIEEHVGKKVLTHIDAVPDNFLFYKKSGQEEIRLIDWEYAGMQDPHLDIAMFAIYSMYDRKQIDSLISIYFENKCEETIRIKIYCYIAAGGFLWSNWCEYKKTLGVEFGDYALRQYQYAKEYCEIVREERQKLRKKNIYV